MILPDRSPLVAWMFDLAQQNAGYSRMIALRGAGYLCGEKAIPLSLRLLNSADQSLRYELAYALGNTQARDAVPILSDFLADKDEKVRRAAVDALATRSRRGRNRSAKGTGSLAKGTAKGAADVVTLHPVADVVTLHPVQGGASVGKGAAVAGKDVAIGTAKGTGKIAKGVGKAFKSCSDFRAIIVALVLESEFPSILSGGVS
jgi:hypothetical protein